MLIEQLARALRVPLVGLAFHLAASEPRAIGLGLFRRLLPFVALPEPLQIDHFPHNHPHEMGREDATILKSSNCGAKPKRAPASSVVIVGSPCQTSCDSTEKYVPLCENDNISCCITAPRNNNSPNSLSPCYDL